MNINYSYLRPLKGEHLKSWHEKPFELFTPSAVSYENAIIFPLRRCGDAQFGAGGVLAKAKTYVESSGIYGRLYGTYDIGECIYDDCKVVYCGYLIPQWGHFLVEAVSRLWYFLQNDTTIEKYIFFLEENVTREIKGNYREFFSLLGILDKIEVINRPVKYREVIVPELGYYRLKKYSCEHKNMFEYIASQVSNIDKTYPKKIYFTRSKLKNIGKKEFGLEMLDDYFEKNGYTVLAPEKLSLSEMIRYIRNAEVCATLSGSLPHNMLFAKEGQKLQIIERNVINNDFQPEINNIKDLDVTYIDANIGIYPIAVGYGPFIMAYNKYLAAFTADNKMQQCDKKYLTPSYLKKMFQKYMKAYRKDFYYQWFSQGWEMLHINYVREAYDEAREYYGDYLEGRKPFKFSHYFMFHYHKQILKQILKKCRIKVFASGRYWNGDL